MALFERIQNLFNLSGARGAAITNSRSFAGGNHRIWREFRAFVRANLGLVLGGLAAAAILAYAVHSLIVVVVEMILMPIIGLVRPSVQWSEWALVLSGSAAIPVGTIIHHLLYAAGAVGACWLLLATLRRKPSVAAERRKNCPMCGEVVLEVARKCRYCGSDLRGVSRSERFHPRAERQGPSGERRDEHRRRYRPRRGERSPGANAGQSSRRSDAP